MIKFSDFMPVDFPDKTKVKFNMNAGNTALRAWDYLLDDAPEWVAMNAHKRKQANNNLNHADYFWLLLSIILTVPNIIFLVECIRLKKFSQKYLMLLGISLHFSQIMRTTANG